MLHGLSHVCPRQIVACGIGGLLLALSGCASAPQSASESAPRVRTVPAALQALPAPAGVDAALWQQLKAALREALANPQPGAGAQEVSDLAITVTGTQSSGANAQFTWTYVNGGDCDQNGEVNIADLTPLGLHFAKTSASPDWAAARMADGDQNGEINIADVTPIGANFGGIVEGYRLQSSPDESGWTDVSGAQALLAEGTLPPGGGALGFSLDLPAPTDGLYYRVEAYTGSTRGAGSNSVLCEVPPGFVPLDPQANNDATPDSGPAPFTATFDASASFDPDGGSITHYEWDVDGIPDNGPLADGFEIDGGAEPTLQLMWYSLGLHQVRVRVTDDEGATDIEAHSVHSLAGATWHVSYPFGETPKQQNSSECPLIDLNGVPAIAWGFGQVDGAEIRFRRADDAQGSGWTESVLDTGFDRPLGFDMLMANGKPSLPYAPSVESGIQDFRYGAAIDSQASGWTQHLVVSYPASGIGGVSNAWVDSAVLCGARPAFWYRLVRIGGGSELWFCLAESAAGLTWNDPVNLPVQLNGSGPADGGFISGAVIGGKPAIAYYEFGNGDLLYLSAASASGASWNPIVTVENLENVGLRPRLAEVNGLPAIAYFNDTQRNLKFVRALDADGAAWAEPQALDGEALGVQALAVVNGRPAVAYTAMDDSLRFISAVDVAGTVWGAPELVDPDAPMSPNVAGGRNDVRLANCEGLVQVTYTVNGAGGNVFKFACLY